MFSFQGTSLSFLSLRDSMKSLVSKVLQSISFLVEISGIEPLTSCLQGRRSPSWAKPPDLHLLFFKSGGPKWTRFSAEKPRRLQQSAGLLLRAGFRVRFLYPRLDRSCVCPLSRFLVLKWWAKMDSNHRPHDYQSCALASWAIGPYWTSTFFHIPLSLYPLNWIT